MLTSPFPVVEWLSRPLYTRRIAGSNPTRNTCHNLINEETIISDSSIAKILRKNIANINERVKIVVNYCVSVLVSWENLSRIYLVVKLTRVSFFSFYTMGYSYPITFVNAFL